MNLNQSETLHNLMRSFAGESMARNRYTLAAQTCHRQKLYVLEKVFLFTAGQEFQHAEIFYNFMKEAAGTTVSIQGGYPADYSEDVLELLQRARHNEFEEFDPVYPDFAKVALEEGFPIISHAFTAIAGIERTHGNRFANFAQLLESKQLFISNVSCGWMCLNCGFVFEGTQAPKQCPVCQHEQGYFVRVEMAPWSGQLIH